MVEPPSRAPKQLPDWLRENPAGSDGAPYPAHPARERRSEESKNHPSLPAVPTGDLEEAMPGWLTGEPKEEAPRSREPELGEFDPTSLVTTDDLPAWLKALGREAAENDESVNPSASGVTETQGAQPQPSQEPKRQESAPVTSQGPSDRRVLPLSEGYASAPLRPSQRISAALVSQPDHQPSTGSEVVAEAEVPTLTEQRPIVSSRPTPEDVDDGSGPIIFLGLVALAALIAILYVATLR